MKKVTLYQVSKTTQVVSGDHLELRRYSYDQITPIRNSGEFIIQKDKCIEVTNLPVQKYVFCQKNWKTGEVIENVVYAAFDDQLLELIQCERSKFQSLNDELVCKVAQIQDLKGENNVLQQRHSRLENECLQLKTKLSMIAQMNWWKRIVFIFKGWKYDNGTQ